MLVHVPTTMHTSANGLSRRQPAEGDIAEEDNHEDWLDHSYSFGIEILNDRSCAIAGAGFDITRYPYTLPIPDPLTRPPTFVALLDTREPKPDNPTIPRSDEVQAKDARIIQIHRFLENRKKPIDLTDEEYESVVASSTRYFILDQKLWRCNSQGKHQLVVREAHRYCILKEVHNNLGHKGVYSICTRLLLHFW